MHRRQFLSLLPGATLAAQSAPRRPNVVILLADDLGYSDVGCYGSEIETPHIDALAAAGTRFSRFYNCARCCPTRAAPVAVEVLDVYEQHRHRCSSRSGS